MDSIIAVAWGTGQVFVFVRVVPLLTDDRHILFVVDSSINKRWSVYNQNVSILERYQLVMVLTHTEPLQLIIFEETELCFTNYVNF